MKFFSIIIPTYNSVGTIKNCIKTLQQQTFTDFEILVMDGSSTDDTRVIVEGINDDRIYFFSEQDQGVYDAMNKGIQIADAKWLFFLGSDDLLYNEDVLADMSKILNKTSAKFVYGNVKIVGDTSWAKNGEVYKGETSIADLLTSNICHQCIFYSKEIFEHKLYNIQYKVLADHDFNIYCASRYQMHYVPIIVSFFNAGGISSRLKDIGFEQDKWSNTVVYFKNKLLDKSLYKYRYELKKTIVFFLKQSKFNLAFTALKAYSFFKLSRFL